MAFSVTLQRNNSELNRITKNIDTITTVSGTLKDETSIINPVIKIECDYVNAMQCNYLSIPIFNRFYFVNNVTSIRNSIFEFSCHVDVLSSFAESILDNTGIITRQENSWNLYLNDGSFKVYQNPNVLTKPFPQGFSQFNLVLAIAGY